jgi:ribonuclease BN (tRNA processing enzyme)
MEQGRCLKRTTVYFGTWEFNLSKTVLMNRIKLACCVLLWGLTQLSVADCADISLQVLGSGGPEMGDNRASSGYLIWRDDKAVVMVDAGSGTALNYETSGADLVDLQAVLFTHFHVDHSVDFPSLIKASYFTNRDMDLRVYGPYGNELMPSASEFVENLLGEQGAYRYLNNYLATDKKDSYKIKVIDVPLSPRSIQHYILNSSIGLSAVPVQHGPIPAVAWRVNIDDCSLSFSGDMNNRFGTLVRLAKGSNFLIANNAIPEGANGVARFLHMPPSEIGKISSAAEVGKLILSHRMLRTLGREQDTEREIRRYFSGPLVFANDLDRFVLKTQ